MKKIRQGQTRWKVVIYDPGKIKGYDDQFVAVVYRCFVTKVNRSRVYYKCGNGPYICGSNWFVRNTCSTFRKAMRQAKEQLDRLC